MKLMRDWKPSFSSRPSWLAGRVALLIPLLIVLYYLGGMFIIHRIDDQADFAAGSFDVEGGSHAVAIAAAVVDREVERHWTPNDPFFYPGAALTRMPAYQRGMISAVARFTIALSDQISRTRGSSTADADIQKSTGLFNYPPTVWIYDSSVSWLPTASTESQYKSGVEALLRYNGRLAKGQAVFEPRADNLLDTVERFAADLGASSGAIAGFVENRSFFAFYGASQLYYETKGKMYVYYLLMRELKRDFAGVIKEKQLDAVWEQALASLRHGMELDNFIVLNAAADSQIIPSHLAAQGFFVMRARTQLREITDVLQK